MTTGTVLVTDTLVTLSVLEAGGTADANQLLLGLRLLNRMLDSWANEKAMLYTAATETITMVTGTASYTTASLSTATRPVGIQNCYVRLSGVDYPVEIVDADTYADIGYKTAQGTPSMVYYDNAYPTATFTFFPVPYAAFTAYVDTQRVLSGVIAAATDVVMPPGYERAIVDNLVVYFAGPFAKPITALQHHQAMESRNVLKRQNFSPLISEIGWNSNLIDSSLPVMPR